MGRTGVKSIRKAGATILLVLLCAVAFVRPVSALTADGQCTLGTETTPLVGGNTIEGQIGSAKEFTVILHNTEEAPIDYINLWLATPENPLEAYDTGEGASIDYVVPDTGTSGWTFADLNNTVEFTGGSLGQYENLTIYIRVYVNSATPPLQVHGWISSDGGTAEGYDCQTPGFYFQGVETLTPPPACEEGYEGTYPDCTPIVTPTGGAGITEAQLRLLINEYATKGVALMLAIGLSVWLLSFFRWREL